MRIRASFRLMAALVFLSVSAHAAMPKSPLPETVAMHVSVKSPMGLLGGIDEYVSRVTAGTANFIPPGFLVMMAQMTLPVPLDTWGSDEEAHFILLNTPRQDRYVVVLRADDFSALVASLGERDWVIGETDDLGGFADVRPIVLPNGKSAMMADIGDGKVAVAITVEDIATALEGWSPKHDSDADVRMRLAVNAEGNDFTARIRETLEKEQDNIIKTATSAGFKRDVADGLVKLAGKFGPKIGDELAKSRDLLIELTVAEDLLFCDLAARFADDALATEVANALEKAPAVNVDLQERLPAGAVSAAVNAPIVDIVPDLRNRTAALYEDIYTALFPELKDRALALADGVFDSKPGRSAAGSYLAGAGQYNVNIFECADPAAFFAAVRGAFPILDDMWAASIDNPDLGARFVESEPAPGVYAYALSLDKPEAFEAWLEKTAKSDPVLGATATTMLNSRFYLTEADKSVVMAGGELSEDAFMAALESIRNPSGTPLVNQPGAQAVRKALASSQGTIAVLDADGAFILYLAQMSRNTELFGGEAMGKAMQSAIEKFRPQLRGRQNAFGMSLGADSGWLLGRMALPSDAVGDIVSNYEKFEKVRKLEFNAIPSPEDGVDGDTEHKDEYEDDIEEEAQPEDSEAA